MDVNFAYTPTEKRPYMWVKSYKCKSKSPFFVISFDVLKTIFSKVVLHVEFYRSTKSEI